MPVAALVADGTAFVEFTSYDVSVISVNGTVDGTMVAVDLLPSRVTMRFLDATRQPVADMLVDDDPPPEVLLVPPEVVTADILLALERWKDDDAQLTYRTLRSFPAGSGPGHATLTDGSATFSATYGAT